MGSFSKVNGISQADDAARGISAMPLALRWNDAALDRDGLRQRAANAVEAVDRKYSKGIWDTRNLEVKGGVGVITNYSGKDQVNES